MIPFYTFQLGYRRSAIRIEAKVKYEIFGSFHDPSFIIKNNIFKVDEGRKFFDLIGYQYPWNFAISENCKSLLEQAEITGWTCYPIIIEDSNLRYFGFQVLGKAGPITNVDEDGDPIHGCTEFNINTWDGSDIFCFENTAMIVCASKVKDIIEKAKITNVEFEDLKNW
ncbi:MAG: hypothetical protein Q8861_10615 [Bacteroidota bacterium]|nr:hypothetical protein [Bacteroidota bacterium]